MDFSTTRTSPIKQPGNVESSGDSTSSDNVSSDVAGSFKGLSVIKKTTIQSSSTARVNDQSGANTSEKVAVKRKIERQESEDCTAKKHISTLLTLNDQINQLSRFNQCLPEVVLSQLVGFSDLILKMELPLYQPEMHILLKNVKAIRECCTPPNTITDVQVIKTHINNIEKLYPDLLYTFTPEAFSLIDHLFNHGLIKGKENELIKGTGTPLKQANNLRSFLIELTDKINKIPFEQFVKYTKPFMKDSEFLELVKNEPGHFFVEKNNELRQYWQQIVESELPDKIDELTCKLIEFIGNWCHYPDEFINQNRSFFENIISNALKNLNNENEAAVKHTPLRRIMSYLNDELAQNNDNLLAQYLGHCVTSLTESEKQNLYAISYLNCPYLFEYLQAVSLGKPIIRYVVDWRDSSGRTVFHCFRKNFPNSLLIRSSEYVERILDHANGRELIFTRDHSGTTALESYFNYDGYVPKDIEIGPLKKIIELTMAENYQPYHILRLLNSVSPNHGFQVWLLCHLIRGERLINLLSDPNFLSYVVGDFQNNFRKLLVQHAPLQNQTQQAAFLHQLKALAFSSKARCTITRCFPEHLRALAMPDPFSDSNRDVWQNEVLPFDEFGGLGLASDVELPWTSLLEQAQVCFTTPENPELLQQWQDCHSEIPQPDQLPPFNLDLPSGDSGTYGRSCYFHNPENKTTLRLKFRKQKDGVIEPWYELASEPFKLECLKTWQADNTLPLLTRFPTPLGLYRIGDFKRWLEQSPLSPTKRKELLQCVRIEEDGSVLTYAYQTKTNEHYHCYPYNTDGDGLSEELSLQSLRVAANDLGLLVSIGLAATMLPMYHSSADQRQFVMLAQLVKHYRCPGVLGSFNHDASNYPNISPGVGIRDYADILPIKAVPIILDDVTEETPENRKTMEIEQIARLCFSLILSVTRVFEKEMDYENPHFQQRLRNEIAAITFSFFGKAFGLAESTLDDSQKQYELIDELTRVISFWCETGSSPKWVEHFRKGTLPETVYPRAVAANTRYDNSHANTLTDQGYFKTTHSKGANLGPPNGVFPLLPVNKILTWAFWLHITKELSALLDLVTAQKP